MSDFDVVVIGAGVVGLACAAHLAKAGRSVLIVDRHSKPGQETSSRNSGVIHAGIYYPAGSLKAELCVEGRQMLYERCRARAIAHRKLGKLIVASDATEVQKLEEIQARASKNGVSLQLLGESEVRKREPNLNVVAALWSQETGIVDVHELMCDYQAEAVEHDAMLCLNTEVLELGFNGRSWDLDTRSGDDRAALTADWVVNAAGLHSDRIARLAGLDTAASLLKLHWCKGDYFVLASKFSRSVSHLIYPLPSHAGLGVHLTFDMGGRLIAGPDTEYVSDLTYDVRPEKAEAFAASVSKYLPGVTAADISPGYAGIRPKLQGPDSPFRDFEIQHAKELGFPGLVNLIGIESPGLTASGAIAKRVARIMENS